MNDREVRFLPLELRTEQEENEAAYIEGYPIVFNQETDLGEWRETIDPSAAGDEKLLRDVALMVGHDFGSIPLAHSRRNNGSGTMQLTATDEGVFMRAMLDTENNPKAKEAYSAVKSSASPTPSIRAAVSRERLPSTMSVSPSR